MNPELEKLHPYPFQKLATLLHGVTPPPGLRPIDLSIGEPQHPVAPFLRERLAASLDGITRYPTTRGQANLRQAMAQWLQTRFHLDAVHPERHILPVNGTREALFSIAHAVVDRSRPGPPPLVAMPNPFYQIYEGATLMAGAEPIYVETRAENGFIPDFAALGDETLKRVQLVYLCTPSNPTGTVLSEDRLMHLIELADRHDFVLASDECYSEIWYEAPPPGLLQAAQRMGRNDYRRCVVFHSLSKRSNMPGARTGFVAGDADILDRYLKLRTYTGCATPPFIQDVATLAWSDEHHVAKNRLQYQQKMIDAQNILAPHIPLTRPQAGFYLWLQVPGGGEAFAHALYAEQAVTVLPGAYLGRDGSRGNPGHDHVRVAMVAPLTENREAMQRMAKMCEKIKQK
ncbi:MAG: succinyldiaminopimelate transaminase [Magnetococcales bacterium]|nr:succinyldiaminopimelate transaminase [Magnetococcales bacterium]MBF0322658.1 succinyldiaminopimelate transaminase [Magnetococcales bacterium]